MHTTRRRLSGFAGLAVAILLATAAGRAPARDIEVPAVEALFFAPAGGGPEQAVPALLTTPPGWVPGDAAVVLLVPAEGRDPDLGHRLAEALLAQGAAVLEPDLLAAQGGIAADSGAVPPPGGTPPAVLVPGVLGAAQALHRLVGAGLVVAIGAGAEGEAALLATAGSPELAAAVLLGPGAPAFLPGAIPPGQGWAARAPLLCALVAGAASAPGAHPRRMEAECAAALLAPPAALALAGPSPGALSPAASRSR